MKKKKLKLHTRSLNYLGFRELPVVVRVYLLKCFNAPWSFGHSVKFNLKHQCCVGWNLAFC